MKRTPLKVGTDRVTCRDVSEVAHRSRRVSLVLDREARRRARAGVAYLTHLWRNGTPVYGVNTGFGASVDREIPKGLVEEVSRQISRFHRCGLGDYFDEPTTRAILLVRLASLSRGYSAVRPEVLSRLMTLLERDILPVIPQEGSVGASGDLTPLSYVAATLMGEGRVRWKGAIVPTSTALGRVGLKKLLLSPKEGLAVMNGTSVMTAVAALALDRAERVEKGATLLTALASLSLHGNPGHFDPALFRLKPHPGSASVASRVWKWVKPFSSLERSERFPPRLQDTYALRCAPHVIGVLGDALQWMRLHLDIEINSSNDNPLIDGVDRRILHGGHFYGGHVAFAMDGLKTAVANIADLLDRQLSLLVDPRTNRGLPSNLSGAAFDRVSINHGFKAVQIGVSSWTAEALKLTMPASVFSRSTECHNQDKVSLGTIAARDAVRVLELTEQVLAAHLLAVLQALTLRFRNKELNRKQANPRLLAWLDLMRRRIPFVGEDRPLDGTLRDVLSAMRSEPDYFVP